jgi:hypothetical protein
MDMKGLAMAGVLAVAALTALPREARAADWGVRVVIGADDRGGHRDDWRGTTSALRYGFDRGWREGTEEGHRDGRRLRDRRFWREGDFRHADSGYRGWMGSRRDYQEGYRKGYSAGYRRAYAAARPDGRDRDWDRDRRYGSAREGDDDWRQ